MNILCFSGKKSSGKNVAANYVLGAFMNALGLVKGGFTVDAKGDLWITDLWGDDAFRGRFDYYRDNEIVTKFLEEHVHPYIKLYAFADPLKEFLVNVLNLERKSIYGNNEEKNSPTHILWENMPLTTNWTSTIKSGPMSGRELMQVFGTDIVRKMYEKAWAKATIKRIQKENPLLAVITDCRFPCEVDEVQNTGHGKVIRFLRNPHEDNHSSETALDNYTSSLYNHVIDNRNLNIEQTCEELRKILTKWELLPETKVV